MSIQVIRPGAFRSHLSRQIAFSDDFITANNSSGRMGEAAWNATAPTGATINASYIDSPAGTCGVMQILTGNAGNDSTVWSQWSAHLPSLLVGSRLDVRILGVSTTDCRWWLGLAGDRGIVPVTAGGVAFAGFRYDTAIDQNVRGVTKTGAAAETLVTCGAISTGTWHTYSFDVPTAGTVRFFLDGTQMGTSTTNIPGGPFHILFGIQADAAANKRFYIDSYELYAPLDRS